MFKLMQERVTFWNFLKAIISRQVSLSIALTAFFGLFDLVDWFQLHRSIKNLGANQSVAITLTNYVKSYGSR